MTNEFRFIYVCSPYRGNLTEILQNTKKAGQYCEQVIKEGAVPIAPHLYFPRFLNEEDPTERDISLAIGKIFLSHCDELRVYGDRISEGMAAEIAFARLRGIKINWSFYTGKR